MAEAIDWNSLLKEIEFSLRVHLVRLDPERAPQRRPGRGNVARSV
jgi:hypothetical protein